MKKFLLGTAAVLGLYGSAVAADLPVKAPIPSVMISGDPWVGFYIGLNAGYAFDLSGMTAAQPPLFTGAQLATAPQGFAGGLQAGYNFRLIPNSIFLAGIEAEINGANLTGTAAAPGFITSTSQLNWFGSAGGRFGLTLFPNLFTYGFVGVAFGNPTETFTLSNFVNTEIACTGNCSSSTGGTQTGWAWGFGAEFALDPHWKLGFDWRRYDFGTTTTDLTPVGAATITFQPVNRFDDFRARLNYSF